jgi:hypothetical protein
VGHYVIGLQGASWRSVVEQASGCSDWVFLESAREYRPRQNDRVLGFFGLTEVQLLQRCAVDVYAFTHLGLALPDAGSAWQNRDRLILSLVAPVVCALPTSTGFDPGKPALLRATRERRQRMAQAVARAQAQRAPAAAHQKPRVRPEPVGRAPASLAVHALATPARVLTPPPAVCPAAAPPPVARPQAAAAETARVPAPLSAPRSRIAAAHFRRIHGTGEAQASGLAAH